MRKSIVLTAVAVSMAALAVASPAMAAKFQFHTNIAILANGHTQSNAGHQTGVANPNSNPFQIGVNAAVFSGFGPGTHGSQSIDQTQRGNIAFPFLAPNQAGQVNLAANLDIFSFNGNTQKITQDQNANVLFAFGPQVQRELGLNVAALGSNNNQTVDQHQNLNAFITVGNVQQQAAVNATVFGSDNTQSVSQTQTENAFGAGGTTQQQLGANVVLGGDHNTQSVTQTQTDNHFIATGNQETQVGANVVFGTPMSGTLPAYENQQRGISVGQWACEPGAWQFTANEDEVCVILSGRGRLVWGEGKSVYEFGAGQSFVIPRGFRGTWETIEAIRKIYVVVE